MARMATSSDVFNAIAEPQRRRIITYLSKGPRTVSDVSRSLKIRQPQTSKHLKVLREVGLVSAREDGQERIYSLNGEGLKPIHDWVSTFEQSWNQRFDRLEGYLKTIQEKGEA